MGVGGHGAAGGGRDVAGRLAAAVADPDQDAEARHRRQRRRGPGAGAAAAAVPVRRAAAGVPATLPLQRDAVHGPAAFGGAAGAGVRSIRPAAGRTTAAYVWSERVFVMHAHHTYRICCSLIIRPVIFRNFHHGRRLVVVDRVPCSWGLSVSQSHVSFFYRVCVESAMSEEPVQAK